jgi:hypothetical protein
MMIKPLSKSYESSEKADDKKSFTFSFQLDALDGIEENKSDAGKKKSKPKKTKKKAGITSQSEVADSNKLGLETSDTATQHQNPTSEFETPAQSSETDQKQEDAIEAGENSLIDGSNTGISCNNEAADIKLKKRKKKKAKSGKVNEAEIDEDIDFLVREINILNASQLVKDAPPSSSLSAKSEVKAPSNNRNTAPNKKNEVASCSFSFKSHKDPELSEEQRSLFRYGNGKNLVAIGPPKARDPIWKLPLPPGLPIPPELITGSKHTKSGDMLAPQLSHCSPFSFGFGF